MGPVAGKLRAAAAGQGPVVAFNVLHDDATFVGYRYESGPRDDPLRQHALVAVPARRQP